MGSFRLFDQRVLLTLASTALTLICLELYLRLTKYIPPIWDIDQNWRVVFDPEILYRISPQSRSDINIQGYRDRNFSGKPPGRRRIVVLGDSFTMGWNVAAGETFPKQLEQILYPSFEVYNMGVLGYGPDQSLIQLTDEVLKLRPDIVILALFSGNDFEDLVKNKLFRIGSGGELLVNSPNLVTESLPQLKLTYFARMLTSGTPFSNEDQQVLFPKLFTDLIVPIEDPVNGPQAEKEELMSAILQQAKKIADRERVKLFALMIPTSCTPEWPEYCNSINRTPRKYANGTVLARLLKEQAIPFLDLTELVNVRSKLGEILLTDDGHFNKDANRLIAQTVKEYLAGSGIK